MKSINGTNADSILIDLEAVTLAELMARAEAATLAHHSALVTYSRKVFIPLTQLCLSEHPGEDWQSLSKPR